MEWIQIASWTLIALLLVGLHVWRRKELPPQPFGVFASAIISALIGGLLVDIEQIAVLRVGGYSFVALIVAALCAELVILAALAQRRGQPPRPLAH